MDRRTVDSVVVTYGKGKLKCFILDQTALLDMIPADMVVNVILMGMVAHANQPTSGDDNNIIYDVGSSSFSNPFKYVNISDYATRYFTAKPWINRDGKPVKVAKLKILKNIATFKRYMFFRYQLPLKGQKLANAMLCHSFKGMYLENKRKIQIAMRLVHLYKPYFFFNGVFDNMNTEKLCQRQERWI
ncbi:hypothetical protein HN51_019308 [Arachis hypogaea]